MFADRLLMWVEFVFVRMEEPYIWHQQLFSAEFGNRNRISKQMQHRILLSDWGHDRYWSSIISSCQPSAVWLNRHDDLEVGTSFWGITWVSFKDSWTSPSNVKVKPSESVGIWRIWTCHLTPIALSGAVFSQVLRHEAMSYFTAEHEAKSFLFYVSYVS